MAGAHDAPRPFPSSFSVGSAALSLLIDRQALRIGRLSPGEFSISNGTVDVKYQTWVGDGATGNGTFSGVPSLDVKGYSVRLSSDRRRVVVVRKGLMIIAR